MSQEMPSEEFSALGASASTEFMLAEFSLAGELWRHTDARIESSVNFYLTTAAVLGPGILLFYQAFSRVRLLLAASIPVGLILIFMGLVVSRRAQKSHEIKEKYAYALGLIRRYFLDADPKLSQYIHLRVAGPTLVIRPLPFQIKRLVIAVRIINSLAFGWIMGTLIWLSLSELAASLIGGGICTIVALLITLLIGQKGRSNKRAHDPLGGANGNRAGADPSV